MKKTNDNELSYVENITILLIISDLIGRREGIRFSNQSKKIEHNKINILKNNDELIIEMSLYFIDNDRIFEQCALLQKEIMDEIKWMINFDVYEVNIHVDKLIY